jgi:hypothetical protein
MTQGIIKGLMFYIPPLTEFATVQGRSRDEDVETIIRYRRLRIVHENAPH